jgi:hypothetical protein
MRQSRGAYRISMAKPERRRTLGRPRHNREDNIKMDIRKLGMDA